MAGKSIARLLINIAASTSSLQRDTGKAKKHLRGVKKSAMDTRSVLKGLFAVAGGAGFTAFIKSAIDSGDELGKFADRIGASVEGLSRLEFAAQRSGVGISQLRMGLQRMTRRISEAASGSGEAIGALQELGLSAEKLETLAPEKAFEVLADAMKGLPTQADRVRVAMKLFDSEGVALLQTMKDGAAGIRDMGAASDALGNTLSTDAAQAFARMNDATTDLKSSFKGAANLIAVTLGPQFESLASFMGNEMPNMAEFTRKAFFKVQESIFRFASTAQLAVVSLADTIAKAAKFLGMEDIASGLEVFSRSMLDAATVSEEIANNIIETAQATARFANTTGSAVVVLDEYRGKTERASTAKQKLTNATKTATEAEKAWQETLGQAQSVYEATRTPLEEMRMEFERLNTLLESGAFEDFGGFETYERGILSAREKFSEAMEDMKTKTGETGEFVKQAARNMEDAMAGGFFDLMQGKMDDLGGTFKRMLDRMVADALAAKLASALFGDFDKSGEMGGLLGSIFSGIGSFFGGAKATGGPVTPNKAFLVGEKGPELFVPPSSGNIIPNDQMGGNSVVINVSTPDAGSFRASRTQIAADINRALQRASA